MVHKRFPIESQQLAVSLEWGADSWAMWQLAMMLDEDHMVKVATAISRLIWLFGINQTIQPLYTSDHPVARNAHCSAKGIPLTGFHAPGIEISYPLSSQCILYMLDPIKFGHMKCMDGRAKLLDPHDVEHFNVVQVRRSFRHVYCQEDQFAQARWACKKYPECCDPNRSRVEIRETEGHFLTFFKE